MSNYSNPKCAINCIFLLLALLELGCGSGSNDSDGKKTEMGAKQVSYSEYSSRGNEASNMTQGVLMANIGKAIRHGGTEYAIEFCNLNAVPLVDSLSSTAGLRIGRISTRNRNPANNLKTREDRLAWKYFAVSNDEQASTDTVLFDRAHKAYYYKPIRIGMPMCLQCHGSRSMDIELATLEKISALYPADNAVNYSMGELRGLWKVEFD